MNNDVFDRTFATVQVGALNALWIALKAGAANGVLQFVFLVLSIAYLLWKWRKDATRKGKGPNDWGDI